MLENLLHHNDTIDDSKFLVKILAFHLVQTQYEELTETMRKYIGSLNESHDKNYYIVKVDGIQQFKFAEFFNKIYKEQLLTNKLGFKDFEKKLKDYEKNVAGSGGINDSLHFSHESSMALDRRNRGQKNPFKKTSLLKSNSNISDVNYL